MSKTIQINPELFRIPNQEKKKGVRNKPIRVKNPNMPQRNKTVRNQIMKMIRSKQQDKYKELFDDKEFKKNAMAPITTREEFKKDFNQSLDFLSDLAKKEGDKVPANYNKTLRNYSNPSPYVNLELPNIFDEIQTPPPLSHSMILSPHNKNPQIIPIGSSSPRPAIPRPNILSSNILSSNILSSNILPPAPPYGVLKVGGTKPTYRTWNQTLKNREPIFEPTPHIANSGNPNSIENIKRTSELRQKMAIKKKEDEEKENKRQKKKAVLRHMKRKKIYKRTYRVGRSKFQPKIGVLVSNKTIRSNISTRAQLLKQEPIQDVKKFLIKKGFIKVGTPTPNDILRKMYESVVLICGEVQNHNPENLLYNYVHDAK
jgi:hypothetical protein